MAREKFLGRKDHAPGDRKKTRKNRSSVHESNIKSARSQRKMASTKAQESPGSNVTLGGIPGSTQRGAMCRGAPKSFPTHGKGRKFGTSRSREWGSVGQCDMVHSRKEEGPESSRAGGGFGLSPKDTAKTRALEIPHTSHPKHRIQREEKKEHRVAMTPAILLSWSTRPWPRKRLHKQDPRERSSG